jgi:uncharacterized protein (DUF1330 family)
MPTVDPTPESFKALFKAVPPDTPVVMLNLLRFRKRAVYRSGEKQPSRSGREAYAEYSRLAGHFLKTTGATVVWRGTAHHALIAPADESWDEVLLVAYPSVAAFGQMVTAEEYQRIVFHRTAALLDSRLIAMTPDFVQEVSGRK